MALYSGRQMLWLFVFVLRFDYMYVKIQILYVIDLFFVIFKHLIADYQQCWSKQGGLHSACFLFNVIQWSVKRLLPDK